MSFICWALLVSLVTKEESLKCLSTLGSQLYSGSRHDRSILAGIMNLKVVPTQKRKTRVQENIWIALIKVGKEVIAETLHIEC